MKIAKTYNIKEDYCSFEIAKLLKEKGISFELNPYNHVSYLPNGEINYWGDDEDCINAPTIYMAMKYLREAYGLHISVFIGTDSSSDADAKIVKERAFWSYNITNANGGFVYDAYDQFDVVEYQSYEESCQDAIKYCLENLI